MKLAAAALGYNLHVGAGKAAVLGLKIRQQHLDLGYCVHGDRDDGIELVPDGVHGGAVDHQVVGIPAVSLDVEVPFDSQVLMIVETDHGRQKLSQASDV